MPSFQPALPSRTKEALRARFREARRSMPETAYRRQSAAIVTRLQALPEIQAAETLHVYWPHLRRREVDLRPFIAQMDAAGKRLVLPVVAHAGPPQGIPRLRHVRLTEEANLRTNQWGIREPQDGESVPIENLDVVIVPALGVGLNGHRVGSGFGYYDEFLQTLRIPLVCPVFATCLVPYVPGETHDVPMTTIVTEHAVIRPRLP